MWKARGRKVSSLLTPLSYFLAVSAYQVLWGPLAYLQLVPGLVDMDAYLQTFNLSLVYIAAVVMGWVVAPKVGQKFVSAILSGLSLSFSDKRWRPSFLKLAAFLCSFLFVISFVVLANASGAGALWITDSRRAYQLHRTGVGLLYASTVTLLFLSYICSLFSTLYLASDRFPWIKVSMKTLIFMTVAFFLGSKGQLLGFCLIALVYYNYNVGPVRWWVLAMAGAFALGSISLLQILQGTAENLTATILYADYFHNTSAFLLRVDEFGGFQWGGVLLSSLWSYVPRSLYAEKPYEYGQVLINRILFPGAAEGGSTPGLLLWAGDYLDFGLAGVLIGGLLRGLWFGWIHNYYLLGKPNVIGFVLLLQLGDFVRVFAYIPTPAFLLVAVPLFVCFLALSRDIFGVPARRLAPVGSVKHSRGG